MKKVLFSASDLPIFQNKVYATREKALHCPVGQIRLVYDNQTGFIFNDQFEPEKMIYDENYQNEQAHSPTFQSHLKEVLDIFNRNFKEKKIVEVGCGKGTFLKLLKENNYDAVGFDPAYEGDSPDIQKVAFTPGVIKPSPALALRHVLEHIPNPYDFLVQIAKANGNRGHIYIEVPCVEWICDKKAWFDVFYEHVNYFKLADFNRMFERIIDSGHIFGGQYIYVIADLSTLRAPILHDNEDFIWPADFTKNMEIQKRIGNAEKIAVWGAASKGVIFSIYQLRKGLHIDAAVDMNPSKQGRFLPVTAIPVISPQDALRDLPANTAIIIMNSNYKDEIIKMSENKFNYYTVDNYEI